MNEKGEEGRKEMKHRRWKEGRRKEENKEGRKEDKKAERERLGVSEISALGRGQIESRRAYPTGRRNPTGREGVQIVTSPVPVRGQALLLTLAL